VYGCDDALWVDLYCENVRNTPIGGHLGAKVPQTARQSMGLVCRRWPGSWFGDRKVPVIALAAPSATHLPRHNVIASVSMTTDRFSTSLYLLAPLAGFVLSFVALGFFWVGIPAACIGLTVGFALVAMLAARASGLWRGVLLTLVGAVPMASMLVRFRDNEGSHLLPIALVLLWCGAALWGGWVGALRALPLRRVFAVFFVATTVHALLCGAAIVFSLGDALAQLDTGVASPPQSAGRIADCLIEPMMTALSHAPMRIERTGQWLFFLLNSAIWGMAATLLFHTTTILRQPAMRAT
jgi:hypothetical protein